jgi:RNA polymerase sigma factor (sigma-70 family)
VGPRGDGRRVADVDDDVIRRARDGDQDAWRRIYAAYAGRVAGYLRVQGIRDPEDLTSEVFLAVFRHLDRFEGSEANFRSWLFVIAHRRLIDDRRRAGRRDEVPLDELTHVRGASDTEVDVLGRVGTQRVQELCSLLVPDQRDVLLLRLVADLTVEQVADVVGKSPGAVKAVQRRGLASLTRLTERAGVSL